MSTEAEGCRCGEKIADVTREAGARALEEAAAAALGMHEPAAPDCQEWASWLSVRASNIREGVEHGEH